MNKKQILAGIILFGSLWGLSECVIGSFLRDFNLPAGAIMTGFFAVGIMIFSRIIYKKPGMQLGMGLIAGTLRLLNPFGGCFICSAFAIMAEALIFEIIWSKISINLYELKTPKLSISMGIITSYTLYVGGYIVTQILTPLFSSAGFYLENLIIFIPQILGSGLLAAIIGGITIPVVFALTNFKIIIERKFYYPVTIGVSIICWFIIIVNTIILLGA